MEPSLEFLKRFLHEDLYLVNEAGQSGRQEYGQNPVPGNIETTEQKTAVSYKTLIILNLPGQSNAQILRNDFLKKILEAVNLNDRDIILINLSDAEDSGPTLENYLLENCNILGFLENLPTGYHSYFKDKKYEIHSIKGAQSVWIDPLKQIEEDRSRKIKLWEALKKIYQIK